MFVGSLILRKINSGSRGFQIEVKLRCDDSLLCIEDGPLGIRRGPPRRDPPIWCVMFKAILSSPRRDGTVTTDNFTIRWISFVSFVAEKV